MRRPVITRANHRLKLAPQGPDIEDLDHLAGPDDFSDGTEVQKALRTAYSSGMRTKSQRSTTPHWASDSRRRAISSATLLAAVACCIYFLTASA